MVQAAIDALIDQTLANGIGKVKGVKQAGTRRGNWYTEEEAQRLLDRPDASTLKGLRDRAILAVFLGCGLRRSEVANLTYRHIAQREGRWVVIDMIGKGGRVRTVAMPTWTKIALDAWTAAARTLASASPNASVSTGAPSLWPMCSTARTIASRASTPTSREIATRSVGSAV